MKPPATAFQRRLRVSFADLGLDRASERREQVQWLDEQRRHPAAIEVLIDSRGRVLASERDGLAATWPAWLEQEAAAFLGLKGGVPLFARLVEEDRAEALALERMARWLDLRSFALQAEVDVGGLAAYARAMVHWQRQHRYCGVCGSPTRAEQAGHRLRCTRPDCATEHFPRTDPAIIVIVTHGERALLGRQAVWPARRYSTLAGFVEPGESLEEAVRREVFEESGVRVSDCDYFASQPWPFPSSLMLGFVAEAESPDIVLGDELEDVRWFDPDEFIELVARREVLPPPPLSVSFSLIEHWLLATRGVALERVK